MVGATLCDVSLCPPVGSARLPLTVVMETILLTVECLLTPLRGNLIGHFYECKHHYNFSDVL